MLSKICTRLNWRRNACLNPAFARQTGGKRESVSTTGADSHPRLKSRQPEGEEETNIEQKRIIQ